MITTDDFFRMTEPELLAYHERTHRARALVGHVVFVPRGTQLHYCTGCDSKTAPKRTGRGYEVKIEHNIGDVVRWAGSGGYWRGAHVDEIEVLAR